MTTASVPGRFSSSSVPSSPTAARPVESVGAAQGDRAGGSPTAVRRCGLDRIRDARRLMESDRHTGKIVVRV
ncbi:hypothetical protein ABT173_31870 [Streptomyces sp. NPDC001795]|uniref:hypothetical protein n=1 Tax=Streptomyces sp. NPDC001795 TaxID=3154525 RepID=UPI0033248D4C